MATFEAGEKFGDYTIEGLVAGGGMGKVYAARDALYGNVIALKVLHKGLHADEDWRIRFNLEGVIGQQLKHPHVVAARELIEHDESVGIVLDLVLGGLTVHRVISREYPDGLQLVTALRLFLGIVQGVEYAHGKMVTHGDIKPENVLLAGNLREPDKWVPKVTDFGTVGIMAHPVVIDGRPAVVVSPRYASPEHLQGIDKLEPRSDVYCLGLLLHYLVTGKHASPASDVKEAARNVAKAVSLVQLVDHPEGVSEIVRRCTQIGMDERYQSCRELAVAVREQLDALGAKLDLEDVSPDLATEVMEERAEMKAAAANGPVPSPDATGVEETTGFGDDPPAQEHDPEQNTHGEDASDEEFTGVEGAPAADPEASAPVDEPAPGSEPEAPAAQAPEEEELPDESPPDSGPSTMDIEAALASPAKKNWDDLSEDDASEEFFTGPQDAVETPPMGPPMWVWAVGVGVVVVVAIVLFAFM